MVMKKFGLIDRRRFVLGAAASGLAAAAPVPVRRVEGTKIKLALNAYSFNRPLRDGKLTLGDLVDFCARHNFDALDATGYYFPGYPDAPPDEYIYSLKRRAFVNGLTINGTGVRNDFTLMDGTRRGAEVRLVKNWIEVAAKLGAGVIRIFAGQRVKPPDSFGRALKRMTPALKECAAYGREHGVIVAVQNHNNFLKTAAETIQVIQAADSEWFGVMLDVGSLRQHDPYEEIEKLLPYAVSWQLKEEVWYGGKAVPTDLKRVKQIIDRGGYRGFLPIETLGAGDPNVKVPNFLKHVRALFGTSA